MKRIIIIAAIAIITASANSQNRNRIRAWFPDDTGLEIYTESTGASRPTSVEGGGGLSALSEGKVFRTLVDSEQGILLFGYELEVRKSEVPNAVFIRIAPMNAQFEAFLLKDDHFRSKIRQVPSGNLRFPTVSGAREFPEVKIGEAVKLDILYNPSTKETIYDVLRPLAESNPYPGASSVSPKP